MSGIRLIAQLDLQTNAAPDFIEAWRKHLGEVSGEPGCVQYEMFQSVTAPDRVVMLEHWESQEAFDAHWELETKQEGGPGVASVNQLIGGFAVELYDHKLRD